MVCEVFRNILMDRIHRCGEFLFDKVFDEGISQIADMTVFGQPEVEIFSLGVRSENECFLPHRVEFCKPCRTERCIDVLVSLIKFFDFPRLLHGDHGNHIRHGIVALRGCHGPDGNAENQDNCGDGECDRLSVADRHQIDAKQRDSAACDAEFPFSLSQLNTASSLFVTFIVLAPLFCVN